MREKNEQEDEREGKQTKGNKLGGLSKAERPEIDRSVEAITGSGRVPIASKEIFDADLPFIICLRNVLVEHSLYCVYLFIYSFF
jgi:hypothetical protein